MKRCRASTSSYSRFVLFTEPTFLFLFLPILLALYFATFSREHSSQEIVGRHLYNFIPSPELVPRP